MSLFAITNEGTKESTIFAMPELETNSYGKGSKIVASCLYNYLHSYLLDGEKPKKICIYADNCTG